jgi:quinoprotein glucose dehydrogenase
MNADGLKEILTKAVEDASAAVRSEARSLWAVHDPIAAVPFLAATIANGETIEKQSAIATLADLKTEAADAVLGGWLDRMAKGEVPGEIQLDLVEAAEEREPLKSKLAAIEAARSEGDVLAAWRVSLTGGDAERGEDIFFNRASVSCQRCHKAKDGRGGEVGPDLSKIGDKKDRNYLLEAIVAPNAKIAENFESVVVVTTAGQVVTGVKRAEDGKSLTLITAEGKGIVIPKDEIEDRAVGKSAMPEDLIKHLSKRDVRDLVEFLANQK